ncbi:81f92bb3-9387-40d3-9018-06e60f4faefa [Thermothielavioides terrestris]|uniref:81f92bb3-9387-40d3-9018-06e60f4faefa n=1 Tax=Thermothielavioides terrestris TaxID=2587410 RepID=A0A446BEP6_9PEZI|nr:81f92bb3-9387-40d3-9018-06e60f4faefa [Thermothielavioides terrestris]
MSKMETVHGLDVSWMTHGNPKDRVARNATTRPRSSSNSPPEPPPDPPPDAAPNHPPSPAVVNGRSTEQAKQQTTPTRQNLVRTSSDEKRPASLSPTPQRRNSWFSNISSKFSSGGGAVSQSPPQASTASPKLAEFSVPKVTPAKNAVLQHASKHEGEGPYTPAPPRSSQTGLFQVFRRLSSSSGTLSPNMKSHNHGLVERRVLNVDRHRERCAINGLNQAKLRRVAFCVDVEIAPMPKYADEVDEKDRRDVRAIKDQKKKIKERGEGEALKHPRTAERQKEVGGETRATGEEVPKEPPKEGVETSSEPRASVDSTSEKIAAADKKREKKKKSEEERKARKEKRRKQAEANGTIPMELHYDSDSSSSGSVPRPGTPKTQTVPTTNPVRIYRRCCQLRETPILRKITEQLMDPANCSTEVGVVEKLDLSGYWMQLTDLVTLGDYLAVVPVREVILESCGLTDEGLRVILAGLLAAKKPKGRRRKHPLNGPDGLTDQGGVVERLVLKNNKIGPEGWKHLCLFIYLCRTLKSLDLSGIQFPRQADPAGPVNGSPTPAERQPQGLCQLLSKSLGERLGGSTLSLLGLGQTGLNTEQLGSVIDGVIRCGVKRLNLANNHIDSEGLAHVARFLKTDFCEGLDLGGNDLRDGLATLAEALSAERCPLWALSLADCNLTPSSLCKLLPTLAKMKEFRFLDLSHNHELFSTNPSAVSVLRRYLPKMACLKRIHLADCALSPEQAIALAEILPEITGLAHISFLENPRLVELATNAKTEEAQEEACALFASLLAAARVSDSLVCVDIEVPSEQSSDLVKAMAKQVVAYCLRNMELAAVTAAEGQAEVLAKPDLAYPHVLQRLVGRDIMVSSDMDADVDAAPDEDYVIGGTGVVRALTCCLKNRGDESRRQSGEFIRDVENGVSRPPRAVPSGGKAKETSKHLLLSARKIRLRLQPAIDKARAAGKDSPTYHRLMFLDNTLAGIIKRFEDEFPDTRVSVDSGIALPPGEEGPTSSTSPDTDPTHRTAAAAAGRDSLSEDNEDDLSHIRDDETAIKSPSLSRSNSLLSLNSKALAHEEARVLRAGHKFRAGDIAAPGSPTSPGRRHHQHDGDDNDNEDDADAGDPGPSGVAMVGADPAHARLLHELFEEVADEELKREARERGVVAVFEARKDEIRERLRAADPVHWARFVESQEMARANANVRLV